MKQIINSYSYSSNHTSISPLPIQACLRGKGPFTNYFINANIMLLPWGGGVQGLYLKILLGVETQCDARMGVKGLT